MDAGTVGWLEWRHARFERLPQLRDDLGLASAGGDLVVGVEKPRAVEEAGEVGAWIAECPPQMHVQQLRGKYGRLVCVGHGAAKRGEVARIGHQLFKGTSHGANTIRSRRHDSPVSWTAGKI